MKKRTRVLALIMAGAMVASMAGCGSAATQGVDKGSAANEGGATTTDSSNTLNVQIETEVMSLDPQVATDGTSFEVIADFTDGLYQMDPNGEAIEAIAESEEVSEDGLHYTIHLRQDAKWSNGEPVTANDFVYAWQRGIDPAFASEYAFMFFDCAQIKNAEQIAAGEMAPTELGVVATDDYTLDIDLVAPVSFFNALLYFPTFYPVNQAFCEQAGDAFGTSPDTVLSNGAFVVTEYEPSATSFKLVKNPDYYDADKIALDGLNYQVIKDNQQALMSYQQGELDIVKLAGEQVETVKDDAEFQVVEAGYLWYLSPNIAAVPALGNVNMRKAMKAAIDNVTIANNVVKDGSPAADYAVPTGLAAYEGKDFRDTAETYAGYDAAAAAEYYAKACEELGETSFTFDLVVEDDEIAQNVAAVIKEEVESTLSGVTINLTVKPKKQRVADMQDGTYELGLTRWGPDYADPMTYLGMWYTNNSNNYGLWTNAEYDAILDSCRSGELAGDLAARWEALHQAEKIVMDEQVIIPIYQKADATMIKSNVSGIEFHSVALNRVYKNTTKN